MSDNLIIDYINRFLINDVDARVQLFDYKTKYQFQTVPGVDQYNMPLYNIQTSPTGSTQDISYYPVYQGFLPPAKVKGVDVSFSTQRNEFFNAWSSYVQYNVQVGTGDGSTGPYTLNIPQGPGTAPSVNFQPSGLLRGHVDISGVIATGTNPIQDPPLGDNTTDFIAEVPVTSVFPAIYFISTGADGNNIVVSDSGQFLSSNINYGLLMAPGVAPNGNQSLGGYSTTVNTVNYVTGVANVTFPTAIPSGQNIFAQCYFFNPGLPRAMLFWNNTIILRTVPDQQYMVEVDAYLSPAAFLTTASPIIYGYMSEYIARGAARKMLSDTGDTEQFVFYEPLFKEQEMLVWKRAQRQFTSTRTPTIYSSGAFQNNYYFGQQV